jgi:type II secretory pathway component PulF
MISADWTLKSDWYSSVRLGDRRRQRSAEDSRLGLLHVLAIICQPHQDEQLSAGTILRLHSRDEAFTYRRRLRKLAKRIEQGQSLPDALEQTPDILTDQQVLAIRLASQSGTLTSAIQQLIESQAVGERPESEVRAIRNYLFVVGFVSLLVIVFLQAIVIPTLRSMIEEFEGQLVWPIRWLSHPTVDSLIYWAPILFLLAILLQWLSAKAGWMRWLKRRLFSFVSRRQHLSNMSETLLLLASSMQSGRPALGALATLARYHPDSRVRNQLLVARNELDFGGGLPAGLLKAGLIPESSANALSHLDLNTEQGWLIDQIAQSNLQDVQDQRAIVRTLWVPVFITVLGFIVLLFSLALICSLIRLILSI